MHWQGMHLAFCYAELELAWQKDALEIFSVISGARWSSLPSMIEYPLFVFFSFFHMCRLVCVCVYV